MNRSNRVMSALPPKADIVQHSGNVRFVPIADIERTSETQLLAALPLEAGDTSTGAFFLLRV
jgi:hypothetical protein